MVMRCTFCSSEEVVIKRGYSGESLCKRCFEEDIKRKVYRVLRESGVKAKEITLAVSGGKDSMTMLDVVRRIGKFKINIVTVDEGIKDKKESIKIVENYAERFSLNFNLVSFEEEFGITIDEIASREREKKICSYCGVMKRKIINKFARAIGSHVIFTGHNLDDVAQSVLMNIFNADMGKLVRMVKEKRDSNFVRRVKPLKLIPEEETELYAKLNLTYYKKKCPYSGDVFRKRVREMIREVEKIRPGTRYSILSMLEKLREPLQSVKMSNLKRCLLCGEPSSSYICMSCKLLGELIEKNKTF